MTSEFWTEGLAPLFLGAAVAILALVAAGLLLYGGPGFLSALVVVLATHLVSLGVGVARGQQAPGGDPVEVLRRRWFLLLLAVTLAAVFSGAWEWFQGFGARAVTQGLGLAFLSALPLFAAGTVLGSMAALPGRPTGLSAPAPAALLGAGAGALLFGVGLFPLFTSSTGLLVGCLVLVSIAALLHGRTLDRMVWIRAGDEVHTGNPTGRVEEWTRATPALSRVALLEPERLRSVVGVGGEPALPLDRALTEGIHNWAPDGGDALVLGVGRMPVALALARGEPAFSGADWRVMLVDEDLRLMQKLDGDRPRGVGTPRAEAVGDGEGGQAAGENPLPLRLVRRSVPSVLDEEWSWDAPSEFDLIVLDTSALDPGAEGLRIPRQVTEALEARLRPAGVLIVGPLQDGGPWGSLLEQARTLSPPFSRLSLYVAGRSSPESEDGIPPSRRDAWDRSQARGGARPAFLLAGGGERARWPDRVGGYLRVMLEAGVDTSREKDP